MKEYFIVFAFLAMVLGAPTFIVVKSLKQIDGETVTPPPDVIRENLVKGFRASYLGIDIMLIAVPAIVLASFLSSDVGAGFAIGCFVIGVIALFAGRTVVGLQTRRLNSIKGRERTPEEEKILFNMFGVESRQADNFFQKTAGATAPPFDDAIVTARNRGILSGFYAAGSEYTGDSFFKNHFPVAVVLIIMIFVFILSSCGKKENPAPYAVETDELETAENADDLTDVQDNVPETTNIKWDYTDLDDGTISLFNYETDNIPEVIVVPSEVDGKTVTGIERLFQYEENVKKVILPPTLTYIGTEAFLKSVSIEEIEINSVIEKVCGDAFYMCSGLKSLTFPDGLKKIDEAGMVFMEDGLKELHVPASVEMSVDDLCHSVILTGGTTIFAPSGSVWEEYAREYNIPFVAE